MAFIRNLNDHHVLSDEPSSNLEEISDIIVNIVHNQASMIWATTPVVLLTEITRNCLSHAASGIPMRQPTGST